MNNGNGRRSMGTRKALESGYGTRALSAWRSSKTLGCAILVPSAFLLLKVQLVLNCRVIRPMQRHCICGSLIRRYIFAVMYLFSIVLP